LIFCYVNLEGHDFKEIEPSDDIRKRVVAARERQYERYGKEICNGSVSFEQLISNSPITNKQQQYLQSLSIKNGLSNRVQKKLFA
jgi:magnesium chelatase family protein